MDKLELAWDTFDFYTSEICDVEAKHLNIVSQISKLIENHFDSTRSQRKRLRIKFLNNMSNLLTLYKKQLDCINDLIELSEELKDMPPEKAVDKNTMATLKNVTSTLLEEMILSREEYIKYLN
jgi:ferritin-like metal-binding protein YciE